MALCCRYEYVEAGLTGGEIAIDISGMSLGAGTVKPNA